MISTGLDAGVGEDYDTIVSSLICDRLNGIDARFSGETESVVHDYCPVCDESDVGAYNGTYEVTGDRSAVLRAREFVCGFCELHLLTVAEMRMAGVKLVVELQYDEYGKLIRF